MCGIIGFKGVTSAENLSLVRGLLEQSQIRGKHATGVSYIRNKTIKTIKEPLPAKTFLTMHWHEIQQDLQAEGEISLIGHTRYSTSGLEHNQPHFDEAMAVAFNGVVTQADPSRWKELYGFEPKTTNDVEILHHLMVNAGDPLTQLGTASMAVVGLKRNGAVIAFRNGSRPMYLAAEDKFVVVASTKQVLQRTGFNFRKIEDVGPASVHHLVKENWGYAATYPKQVPAVRDLQTERFS
jgi:glutamine phosphoribosylpyrophosphate amidotransferase